MPYRRDITGYMTLADLKAIEALAGSVPENGVVVEIGSYFGRSSWTWAKSVPPSAKVYCIDPWLGSGEADKSLPEIDRHASLEEFLENVKDCPNIIPIQGYSPTMPWDEKVKPDLVYVDGNHFSPHVNNDLAFWSKQLKATGILCGHDFNPWRYRDVCEAVFEQAQSMNRTLRVFDNSIVWYIEMGRPRFTEKNKAHLVSRLGLEDTSWAADPEKMQVLRKLY